MPIEHLLLFLLGCIGTRLLFTFVSYKHPQLLQLLGTAALVPGLGFLILYWFNLRQTGFESFEKIIWWNHLRPVHGMLYLLFAYYALQENKNAWIILLTDTLIGLTAFIQHYFFA